MMITEGGDVFFLKFGWGLVKAKLKNYYLLRGYKIKLQQLPLGLRRHPRYPSWQVQQINMHYHFMSNYWTIWLSLVRHLGLVFKLNYSSFWPFLKIVHLLNADAAVDTAYYSNYSMEVYQWKICDLLKSPTFFSLVIMKLTSCHLGFFLSLFDLEANLSFKYSSRQTMHNGYRLTAATAGAMVNVKTVCTREKAQSSHEKW